MHAHARLRGLDSGTCRAAGARRRSPLGHASVIERPRRAQARHAAPSPPGCRRGGPGGGGDSRRASLSRIRHRVGSKTVLWVPRALGVHACRQTRQFDHSYPGAAGKAGPADSRRRFPPVPPPALPMPQARVVTQGTKTKLQNQTDARAGAGSQVTLGSAGRRPRTRPAGRPLPPRGPGPWRGRPPGSRPRGACRGARVSQSLAGPTDGMTVIPPRTCLAAVAASLPPSAALIMAQNSS